MKDYTIELMNDDDYEKKRKEFILKYVVSEDNKFIKVYYANKRLTVIRYSVENEKKILEKMRNQVINYKEIILKNIEKNKENLDDNRRLSVLFSAFTFFGIGFLLTGESKARALGIFLSLFGSGILVISFINKWHDKVLLDDFRKNLLFIENEDVINKILSEDSDILLNFTESIIKGLVLKKDNSYECTINSIDKISYQELIKMLTIINKEKEYVIKK